MEDERVTLPEVVEGEGGGGGTGSGGLTVSPYIVQPEQSHGR